MNDLTKQHLFEQAGASSEAELQLLQRFTKILAGDFIELVRDVLRDENSDLSYAAADQIQRRIHVDYLDVEAQAELAPEPRGEREH